MITSCTAVKNMLTNNNKIGGTPKKGVKKKMKNILIVEKQTNYEYLQEHQGLNTIPPKSLTKLKERHEKHYEIKKIILEELNKNKFSFTEIKDHQIESKNYSKYDAIITLGGDGTLLHAVKYVTDQVVIGVNTDVKNSVGFLTKHTENTIIQAIRDYATNSANIEEWDRISASIDGKELPYKALNEVVISVPLIFQTSHITITHGDKKLRTRGNGLIAATNKGSYAFYKSAGGSPFSIHALGYTIILPYSVEGDLDYVKQILPVDEVITVQPNREDHVLIFDCDETRKIKLLQESEVKIEIKPKNRLKVLLSK